MKYQAVNINVITKHTWLCQSQWPCMSMCMATLTTIVIWGEYIMAVMVSVRKRPFCLECASWLDVFEHRQNYPKEIKINWIQQCIHKVHSPGLQWPHGRREKCWLFKGGFANCNQLVLYLFMSLNSSVVPVTTLEMKNIVHFLGRLEQHFKVNENNTGTNTISCGIFWVCNNELMLAVPGIFQNPNHLQA